MQGGYGFKEKTTGRPLRYQGLDQIGNPYVDKDGNALVTLEGIAPRVLIYFAGTAFLVDRAGTVVTNRHMVRMWESYEPAKEVIAAGFEPDIVLLRLFFPGEETPYLLTEVTVSDQVDAAVLRTDRVPTAGIPVISGFRRSASRGGTSRDGELSRHRGHHARTDGAVDHPGYSCQGRR